MTLSELGELGSFIGGALGAVALLYLAFQIRQNTTALRMTAYQESVRSANDFSALLVTDPDLTRLFLRARTDLSALDPQDQARVSQLLSIALRNFSFNLDLSEKKLIPRDVCEAYEVGLRPFFDAPAGRVWWQDNAGAFDAQFRSYFDRRLAEWSQA